MFGGIISGYLFRKWKFTYINKIIITLVWLLLFLLGVEVGLNDNVVNQFANLGFEALIIAVVSTLGSILGAWILWRKINPKSQKSDTI
jgi:uncharacterized membrane protein YbjE (DUF340 family)